MIKQFSFLSKLALEENQENYDNAEGEADSHGRHSHRGEIIDPPLVESLHTICKTLKQKIRSEEDIHDNTKGDSTSHRKKIH